MAGSSQDIWLQITKGKSASGSPWSSTKFKGAQVMTHSPVLRPKIGDRNKSCQEGCEVTDTNEVRQNELSRGRNTRRCVEHGNSNALVTNWEPWTATENGLDHWLGFLCMCGVHFTSLHSTLYSSPCTSLWLQHGSETPVQNSKWSQQQVGCLDFHELGTPYSRFKVEGRWQVGQLPQITWKPMILVIVSLSQHQ